MKYNTIKAIVFSLFGLLALPFILMFFLCLYISYSNLNFSSYDKPKEPEEPKKPKEEIKKIGDIDKPLNLSLIIRDETGIGVSYDTINGNIIKIFQYPYSINIVNDSIIFTAWKRSKKQEYRRELTDYQKSKIKEIVSTLNQEYEIPSGRIGPLDACCLCILEIDNQVHYKHGFCNNNPEFTNPYFKNKMPPKEMRILFRYIIGLSPIKIKF